MPGSNVSTQHAYDEATARRWLSRLARGMKSQGLTVFMIEDLQPSWLTRGQRFVYIALSSLFQVLVVAVGALAALLIVEPGGAIWPFAMKLALPLVLANIAFESRRLLRAVSNIETSQGVLRRFLRASARGLLVGLIVMFAFGISTEGLDNYALAFVMLTAFLFGWAMDRRMAGNDIQTVEHLQWSWRLALLGITKGIAIAVCASAAVGVLLAVMTGDLTQDDSPFTVAFTAGLLFLFITGPLALIVGGLRGFKTSVSTMKVEPNQGIRESLKNSLLVGGVTLATSAGLMFAVVRLIEALIPMLGSQGRGDLLAATSSIGLMAAGPAALLFGGQDVIRHYTLRVILYFSGAAPLNIARFLDYAAGDLQILQKVGGGYIFIHRFLLEHFAEMSEEGSKAA